MRRHTCARADAPRDSAGRREPAGEATTPGAIRPAPGTVAVCVLTAVLAAAGIGLLWLVGPTVPPLPLWSPLTIVVVIAVAFALSESFVIHLPLGRHAQSFSLNEVPLVVGLHIAPPVALVVGRLVGVVLALARLRVAAVKSAFTVGQFLFETGVVVSVWTLLLGGAAPLSPRGWFATLAAVVVGDVLSAVLLVAAMNLHDGGAQSGRLSASLRMAIPPALANGAFGLTVVFVLAADWRAVWLPMSVTGLLYLGHRANVVLTRRHDELQRVNQYAGSVVGHLEVEAVLGEVVSQLGRQLEAEHVQVTLFDGDQERTWRSDPGFDLDSLARLPADAAVVSRNSRNATEQAVLDEAGVADAMVVALPGDDGQRMGSIVVADHLGDFATFGPEDLAVFQALANHTAAALRNAELADRLRRQVIENEHRALHDALTELPNRRLFTQRIEEASGTVAVLMMDLDGFKDVNDALGHGTGDELLKLVAQRLTDEVPARCIARIGGDEFVLALEVAGEEEAIARATQTRATLLEPFTLPDMALSIDASIGVVVGDASIGADELLKRSDVAMYEAKTGRLGVQLYDAANDRSTPDKLLLPSELREAIRSDGLAVHYQPKATLATDTIESLEALVRWVHPRRGMVSPAEFIPLAEQTGLIVELTHHVLQCALQECRVWRDAGHDVSVAVNLSPRVLHDEALPDVLAVALARAGLPASALTLEITESGLMADPARAVAILQRLADMGVVLSVDDLGTGYSSLAYLKRLPVHEVKIDRSFVMGMGADDDDAAIVEAVVALGQRLGKRVVAEGVEDAETYERLRAMGCDVAQGYWLSRPMPARDVMPWLDAHWQAMAHAAIAPAE